MVSTEYFKKVISEVNEKKCLSQEAKDKKTLMLTFLSKYCDDHNLVGLCNALIRYGYDTPEIIMETNIEDFWRCRNLGITRINILRQVKGLDPITINTKSEEKDVEVKCDISDLTYEELRVLRNAVCRRMREIEREVK